MIEEIHIMERQAKVAKAKGDFDAYTAVEALVVSLGIAVIHKENAIKRELYNAGDLRTAG